MAVGAVRSSGLKGNLDSALALGLQSDRKMDNRSAHGHLF